MWCSDVLELMAALVVLGIGLWPLLCGLPRFERSGAAKIVAGGCGRGDSRGDHRGLQRPRHAGRKPINQPSEVPADGYVSSDACRSCHPGEYATWRASYHSTMTQVATPETVLGDFSGQSLTLFGITYTLDRRGDEFWIAWDGPPKEEIERSEMIIEALRQNVSGGAPPEMAALMIKDMEKEEATLKALQAKTVRHERPIVQLTGSHHYQIAWYPSTLDRRRDRLEIIDKGAYKFQRMPDALQGELLPFRFVWQIDEGRWLPRDAVFVAPEDKRDFGPWNNNCIKCHTTHGRPRPDIKNGTMQSEVAEFGIACESCHGPAGEHGRVNGAPHRRYGLHLSGDSDNTIVQPGDLTHKVSSQVCGQCHSVSRYRDSDSYLSRGSHYRPGEDLDKVKEVVWPKGGVTAPLRHSEFEEIRDPQAELEQSFWSDGVVRILGREYNGMLDSACHQRGEMACTSCHEMHGNNPDDQLGEGMRGDKACLQCHGDMVDKIEAHTHHKADSAGSACMNCHMPYTAFGLLKAARNHTITSPSAAVSAEVGRPNACNLCHLDKTLAWTAEKLSAWYGAEAVELSGDHKEVSAALVWLLSGDAAQRALIAVAMGRPEAQEASGNDWTVPFLSQILADPYAALRLIAERTLRTMPGQSAIELDLMAKPEDLQKARDEAVSRWLSQREGTLSRTGPEVLLDGQGNLDEARMKALLKARNDRPVILAE